MLARLQQLDPHTKVGDYELGYLLDIRKDPEARAKVKLPNVVGGASEDDYILAIFAVLAIGSAVLISSASHGATTAAPFHVAPPHAAQHNASIALEPRNLNIPLRAEIGQPEEVKSDVLAEPELLFAPAMLVPKVPYVARYNYENFSHKAWAFSVQGSEKSVYYVKNHVSASENNPIVFKPHFWVHPDSITNAHTFHGNLQAYKKENDKFVPFNMNNYNRTKTYSSHLGQGEHMVISDEQQMGDGEDINNILTKINARETLYITFSTPNKPLFVGVFDFFVNEADIDDNPPNDEKKQEIAQFATAVYENQSRGARSSASARVVHGGIETKKMPEFSSIQLSLALALVVVLILLLCMLAQTHRRRPSARGHHQCKHTIC